MKEIKGMVSVIVPFYNRENFLRNCIESLISQTYKNIEIILVDDGSSDRSRKICKEYESKNSSVKLIAKDKNEGVVKARKAGVDFCNGEFVMFVDSDDRPKLDMVQVAVEANKESKYDLVIFNFKSEIRPHLYRYFDILELDGNIEDFYKKIHKFYQSVYLTYVFNKLYKAKYLKNNENFFKYNYKIAEDLQLNLGYFENRKTIKIINKVLYTYNMINESSASKKCFAEYYDHQFSIHKVWKEFLAKHCNIKENELLQKMFFGDTRDKVFYTARTYVVAKDLNLYEKLEFLKYIVNDQKNNEAFKDENCSKEDEKKLGFIIRKNQWLSFYDFIKQRL